MGLIDAGTGVFGCIGPLQPEHCAVVNIVGWGEVGGGGEGEGVKL